MVKKKQRTADVKREALRAQQGIEWRVKENKYFCVICKGWIAGKTTHAARHANTKEHLRNQANAMILHKLLNVQQ